MLRTALLWASTNPFLSRRLPRYAFVRRATRRSMPGETLDDARRRLERIVEASGPAGLVWLDMESSAYVDPTLEVFRAVRQGHAGLGLCLQAYLRRTEGDLEDLLPLSPAIRLVKGAYREPPEGAFPRKKDVDRGFMRLAATLLEARKGGRGGWSWGPTTAGSWRRPEAWHGSWA